MSNRGDDRRLTRMYDEDFDVVEFHFTGRDADPTRRDFLHSPRRRAW